MKQLYIQLIVCFIALFSISLPLQAQQFEWAKGGGTSEYDADLEENPEGTYYLCTDVNGNVYALNNVGGTAIYADTFYKSGAYGADRNIFLTSYDCSGQMRWAKLIASSADQTFGYGIVADSSGHIYVAGYLPTGTLYIGYDTSISGLTNDLVGLMQFDTSGHFNWIQYIGNNTAASYYASGTDFASLSMDNANNIHFVPYIKSGAVLMTGDTSKWGSYDLKYNSAGTLLSAQRLALDSTIIVVGTTIDQQNNTMYATGYRDGIFTDSSFYAFIGAFDTAGNQKWIDTLNCEDPGSDGFFGIAPDGAGHLYTSGDGYGYIVYRGDTISHAGIISFITKMDTSGDMQWVRTCSGENQFAYIALTPNNKVASLGTFYETVTSGTYSVTNTTAGSSPLLFIVDTGGNFVALQGIHGDGYENGGWSLTCDKIGNLYIGGYVADSIPVECCNNITPYVSRGGNTDFFVLKYGVDCSCTSMPMANYTITGTSTVSATYTGTVASGIDSVVWSFGDGTTDTGITVNHVYTVMGTVDVCATVYTGCGNDLHCSNIMVNCTSTPSSAFTDTGSTVRGFTYTGTTVVLDSISWNFGDGYRDTGAAVIHTYSTSGTYTVCATVYTGCGSNTACHTVTIDCNPVSSYTYSGSLPVNYTYTGTTIPGLDSVVWSFGDGSTTDGTTPAHTYSASGTYSVCATAYTICGSNTHCNDVVVDCSPTASFTQSGTTTKSFTYTGTTLGLDSVVWNYGDGNYGYGTAVTHTYTASATYTACVTAFTACGGNTSCSVIVIDCTPVAAFTDTGAFIKGFTYTGTSPELDSIVWSFGDGSAATGSTAMHTYTATATYTVCVTAYGVCGSSTICQAVLADCTPVSSFIYSGLSTITFDFTGFPSTAGEGLDSVYWIFGDGPTASGLTVVHTYTSTGTFTPCAEVFSACGHDMYCKDIFISCLANASFTYTSLSTGTGVVAFTYTGSTTEIDSIVWYFGDGTTDTGLNPQHIYADTNVYNVCVVLYSACGVDSSCSEVAVGTEGVPVVSNTNIQVFPNPAGDQLNITGITENTNYRLLSITGVCVQKGVLHSGSNTMVIGNVAAGVYVLEVTGVEGKRDIVKVVKE